MFKLEEEITKFKYLVEADDLNKEKPSKSPIIEEENGEESGQSQNSESMMKRIQSNMQELLEGLNESQNTVSEKFNVTLNGS